ncbi:iron-siderophore ABC transporter substrate-binding protein [Pleurocapsa sp. CCALA 161]|uniref:iron-siderophore ABC transporter substrate-binding protein n=1 Tax=Pleurocapsa sp. CCALA 161 TaxID=2107688 RepID=UPI0011B25FE9|nr:iron-siderophore ABC transporter substrate-binding protein [Pleurocapsa sp. CCALA 161]
MLFLLGILIVVAIAACNNNTPTKPNSALTDNCRVIQHAMGETCVPLNPQRIVVLDSVMLEAAIALDEKPVGSPLEYIMSPVSTEGIEDLGDVEAINLERVLALKPDLILGLAESTAPYSQLSQIAPTVLVDFEHSGEWKEHFAFVGKVLGKSEQVDRVMSDYYQRAKEFQQKMSNSSKTYVSIVRIYPTQINLYTKAGFPGTVLEDAGLSRPTSQDLNLEETKGLVDNPIQYTISEEVINKADGDAVFVVVGDWDAKIDEVLTSLKADPLWLKLEAVQQGKVYEVPDYWLGSGAIAANAVLDDLFEYLLEDNF